MDIGPTVSIMPVDEKFLHKIVEKMMNTYIMVNVYSQEVLCDFNSIKTDNVDLYMVISAENYKPNMNSCLQID